MKLCSCHIENFGKISNTDINFNAHITSFCQANAYGKTTLAAFLKAMFYGMDSIRATDKEFKDRRHFYPFGGGNFGGHVTFLWKGKTFKIERYFDETSETRDSITVYCNGVPAPEYGGDIGQKIFEIDKQSFERTVFISGADIDIASTSSINTKLNNFLEGSNDDTNLAAAKKRLEDKGKEYNKTRQGMGLIQLEKNNINELAEKIANLRTIESGLPEKNARLNQIDEYIKDLNEQISKAQSSNVVLKEWEHYDSLLADASQKQTEIKEIVARYPHGVPSAEELERLSLALDKDKTLKAQGLNKQFTEEDGAKFAALKVKFEKGVPTDAELTEIENKISVADGLLHDINALNSIHIAEKEAVLRQRFNFRTPTEEDIAELEAKEQRYKAAQNKCASIPDFITAESYQTVQAPQKSLKLFAVLAAISALVLIGGVAAIFFQMVVGAVLMAVGAIGLMAAGFMYLNKKTNARNSEQTSLVQVENPQKAEAVKEQNDILSQIQAFIAPYGYTLDSGVAFAVASLKQDLNSYLEILNAENQAAQTLAKKTAEQQTLDWQISAFFTKYGAVGDTAARKLSALRADISAFNDLQKRKQSATLTEEELQQNIAQNRIHIDIFCQKYHVGADIIAERFKYISADVVSLRSAKNDLNALNARAAEFKQQKNLAERPNVDSIDIRELNERLLKAQDSKNFLFTEIKNDESQVEQLEDFKNESDAAKERLQEYKAEYDLIEKTIKSLEQADKNLKDKYVKPIKDKFIYYSTLLSKALGEKFTMDANFDIRFEQNGKEHSEKHLSFGQRSICALCFRLALIDNMYAEEKPFLILDDPFASLDEVHIHKVKELLAELSKRLQIVYFACHNSRSM